MPPRVATSSSRVKAKEIIRRMGLDATVRAACTNTEDALIERAINGPELPGYEGAPDSGSL